MATAQDILSVTCWDLLEDGGLVLGLLTNAEFLDLLNESLTDFLTESCLMSRVFTQTVFAGVGTYTVPDDIIRPDYVFLGGRYLPKATMRELNSTLRNWRRTPGPPQVWYTDGLPNKTIGLAPAPDYNGDFIIGPNEPDPPHAVYDSFSAIVQLPDNTTPLENPAQHGGLTIIGPCKNAAPLATVGDTIPLLPDEFSMAYLGFGVLQRIFSGDNEFFDNQKAAFCAAQVKEGISLAKEITSEPEDQ